MKKIIILISISILVCIFALFIIIKFRKTSTNTSVDKNQIERGCLINSSYYYDDDTGWLYSFVKQTIKENKENIYSFDVNNMKYSCMEGYEQILYDENGEIIEKVPAVLSSMHTKYSDEFDSINNFFNSKNFTKSISNEDLSSLEVSVVDKDILCKVYNDMLKSNEFDNTDKSNQYITWPSALLKQEENYLNGYMWQVACNLTDKMAFVNIEIIYEDGTYLSDLVKEGKATEEQKEIYNKITEVSTNIVKTQEFVDESIKTISYGDIKFSRLYDLLDSIKNPKE